MTGNGVYGAGYRDSGTKTGGWGRGSRSGVPTTNIRCCATHENFSSAPIDHSGTVIMVIFINGSTGGSAT